MGQVNANAMQESLINHYHRALKETGTRTAALELMVTEIMADQKADKERKPGIQKAVMNVINRYENQQLSRLEMSFQLRD